MLKVILFLETIVKKPIFVLKKDFEAILKSEIGCTKLLLSDSNEIFIDDIVEESLIINEETKETFPIHRIFVQGVECEQDYCNVGWILNEDMPVCSLCRIEFSPFDMKQHCKACGNICCQDCSSNVVTITGLEVLGGLRVCNLCFYGQDKVSLVGSRHTTRFEIINQGDLEKGLTDIIKVKDRNNKGNNYDGINRRSILPSTNDLKLHLEGNNHGSLRRKSATALKEQLRDSNKKRDSKILSNSMIDLDTDTTTESMASTTTTKEVETLLSISEPARLVGSKSSRFDTSLTPTLPKTKEEILATLQPPPKIMGWLRKRGHLIQNWKSRYFVLDNGFLTYYLDKIDRPPYGKNVKGQICLAGYREKKESIFHDELASESGRGNSGIAMTISRDSSKTTTNVLHMDYLKNTMIHLEYTPGIVKEDVILYLKHSNNRSPDHTFQNEDSLTPNNSLQFYEFILETNSMEEKVSWCAAIQQHTEYIENISQSIKNCNDEGRLISDDFNHYKSLTDDQSSASSSNPSSPGSDHRNNQNNNKSKKDSKRSSYSFRGNTKNSSPPPQRSVDESGMTSSGNLSASMAARPLSLRQSVIHSQKYHIFIYSDEIMIFSGLIGKPNKVSVQKFRELVFVKTKGLKTSSPSSPNNKTTTGTSSLPFHTRPNTKQLNSPTSLPSDNNEKNKRCLKRLLYIDTSKYELKGDIRWIENEPSPTIKAVGDKYFEIYDQRLKKSYHFYPKDGATVTQWIEILNGH